MDRLSLEQKQQQFDEFFTIQHSVRVNMLCVAENFVLPDQDELSEHMPFAFQVASEVSSIDAKSLRLLRNMGEHGQELVDLLNAQSRKIDLLMSLVLQQQDDPTTVYMSYKFGGGGIILISNQPFEPGQITELKIFLKEEASAIFCFGEVIACQGVADSYHISLIFNRIREEDQDLLVRASLHLQTLQLRKRAKQQKNEK